MNLKRHPDCEPVERARLLPLLASRHIPFGLLASIVRLPCLVKKQVQRHRKGTRVSLLHRLQPVVLDLWSNGLNILQVEKRTLTSLWIHLLEVYVTEVYIERDI